MSVVDFVPFMRAPSAPAEIELYERSLTRDAKSQRALPKLFKMASLAVGMTGLDSLAARSSFEPPPQDFDRINKAVDTDSYIRQGLNKYQELLWKEGWEIVSENDEAVKYLKQRIAYMEFAMGKPFQSMLTDITDQLIRFHNAFAMKSRGDLARHFPSRLYSVNDKQPVVGYYVTPAETIEIQRDKRNRPMRYRQRMDTLPSAYERNTQPTWSADEVIHFTLDRKPGRAFGTPFLVSAMDDVVALRQLEEDIQNLVHKELFPLYKYQVGTESDPAEPEEINHAYAELANLKNDGGIILPERHDVSVIGAQSNALDATGYLSHFVGRVVVGMGLSPHHLGIMSEGGNRSVTDRLDIALYDKIKAYQRYIADMVRITIFNEILLEGGYDPYTIPEAEGVSDRCDFVFREIDVDTQVKRENHAIQKWLNNGITWEEFRGELGRDTGVDEKRLFSNLFGTRGKDKQSENRQTPQNQHGSRTSPDIRHSEEPEEEWEKDFISLFEAGEVESISLNGLNPMTLEDLDND